MLLLGAVVNSLAVVMGGSIGLLLKRGLSAKVGETIMGGLALCVLYIGISGSLAGEHILLAILAMALGALCGEWLDLDGRTKRLGERWQVDSMIAQGFITASLLFCVGAMAIVGSLQSGLTGNHETLFAKSLIDGIAALVLASSLGVGVLLSGGLLLVYEGGLTLLAKVIEPYLTTSMINEITCVGSLLIIGIALNMLKVTNLKIMNYVPAIFFIIIFCLF
ncbi:MAG: DUF554 domain-containing protein [Peptococcia bacterium]|jgi:uncharacterized membrane protein YqgA involved in biofilm formation